jgi:aminoglycoside phosphotransferase (APT) family kinase protein
VRQFEGGQSNPTFALRAGSREYVLRKQPPGELLPSAHQVDREYRVMHALRHSDVPVPKMYALCEDTSVIGTKFYVMEKVAGRVFTDLLLPSMNNDERRAVYKDLARVSGRAAYRRLSCGWPRELRQAGNYYTRQISRWSKQYIASQTESLPAMDKLMNGCPSTPRKPTKR